MIWSADFSCQSPFTVHCLTLCLHPGVLHVLAGVLSLPTVLLCLLLLAEVKIWLWLGRESDIPVSCSFSHSLFRAAAYDYGLLSFKSVKNLLFFFCDQNFLSSLGLKILSLNQDGALAH